MLCSWACQVLLMKYNGFQNCNCNFSQTAHLLNNIILFLGHGKETCSAILRRGGLQPPLDHTPLLYKMDPPGEAPKSCYGGWLHPLVVQWFGICCPR